MSNTDGAKKRPSWRASVQLLVFTSVLGLFTENFLYGFVVPILPYMIETRLGLDSSYTQRITTELLFIMGLVSIPAAPVIGHFADQTTSRKIPLLISLLGCTIGTVLVAFTPAVWAVYAGRILQGVSGTGAWIVGFAMLTDAAGSKHLGKALGSAGSFITAGILTGPVVSGALLQFAGYWPAWSVPFALLVICFLARLAMDENKLKDEAKLPANVTAGQQNETDPLLPEQSSRDIEPASTTEEPKTLSSRGFYRIMFSKPSTYAALLNVTSFSMTLAALDTTLPVHLRNEFGWRSAPIGSIFLAIQVPGMIFGPFVGLLRDKIGLRWPTTLGWALVAPLFWFLGVPGKDEFLGVGADTRGQAAFVAAIVTIGCVWSLTRGAGTFQLTTIMHQLKEENPNIFGSGGGSSRTFSLTEASFSIGLVLGPIVSGYLADNVGFYYAMLAQACICVAAAVSSFLLFEHKVQRDEATEETS